MSVFTKLSIRVCPRIGIPQNCLVDWENFYQPYFQTSLYRTPRTIDHLTWETIPVFAHLCQFAGRVAGLFHLISDVFCDHQILTMIFSLTTPSFHWDRQDTWGMKHQTWDIQQAADYSIYWLPSPVGYKPLSASTGS